MKTILFLGALLISSTFAFSQTDASVTKNGPLLTFEENTFDFGTIAQGDKVDHVFKFTNTGNESLIITNIQVTCGCTAPAWPRHPIPAGEKGEIKVVFNSSGKMGNQNKVVTVVSNAANDDNRITFTASVVAQKDPQ